MATIGNRHNSILERFLVCVLNAVSTSFEWLIKACLEKLCEHDEDCFV
jgi:hypothetical protein